MTFSLFFQERIVALCLENRIALYSPHTSFDAVAGGVNDWLLEPFGKNSIEFWWTRRQVCMGSRSVTCHCQSLCHVCLFFKSRQQLWYCCQGPNQSKLDFLVGETVCQVSDLPASASNSVNFLRRNSFQTFGSVKLWIFRIIFVELLAQRFFGSHATFEIKFRESENYLKIARQMAMNKNYEDFQM